MNRKISAALIVGLAIVALDAQAVWVNFSVTGTVDAVDLTNSYGLSVGDTITATAMFDDALISATGLSAAELGDAGNAAAGMLTFQVGSLTFDETMDLSFGIASNLFPLIVFDNGVFAGFEFMAEVGSNGAAADFEVFGADFFGQSGLTGLFNLQSAVITPKPVPEPHTLGLLGLAVAAQLRRRQSTKD